MQQNQLHDFFPLPLPERFQDSQFTKKRKGLVILQILFLRGAV